ncbi:MAG: glutamyl-tRNA reductase [Acidobacteriia bacterium]|nr:glutamyl-tRNA reductase [Terriglobia bacterium]
MEANLVVIGLNFRTASVDVRERFWVGESRWYQALHQLRQLDGIEEVVILVTCNRTEYIVWASDFSTAANSLLGYLNREFGMKLSEWEHFYRLLGDDALLHMFRAVSGLDSMVVGESQVVSQMKSAWAKAQEAGTSGRFLDQIVERALAVSERVRSETKIGAAAASVPCAAVELAKEILGSVEGRKVMILGAGKMSELSARCLLKNGARTVLVANRTYEHAAELANTLGGEAVRFEERWKHLEDADIVITTTGCPHVILTRDEVERLCERRGGRPVFFIDIAVPRNIEPAVREVRGAFLYDLDDLEQVVARNMGERRGVAAEAERLVAEEAQHFSRRLAMERVAPAIVALHQRLDEIGRQEVERYAREAGPLPPTQRQAFETVISRVVQRIAASLAREMKQSPENSDQQELAGMVQKLFQLEAAASRAPVVKGVGNA